jgi:hypothetical protein
MVDRATLTTDREENCLSLLVIRPFEVET